MHRRYVAGAMAATPVGLTRAAAGTLPATAPDEFAVGKWGSFHVGGHPVEISGEPIRDVVLGPGSMPAHVGPNGMYMAGAMYAQYMIPAQQRATLALLMWHGGGLTGVT